MASHLSPLPQNPPDDSQPEPSLFQSSWFGGRSPLRTRRRVIFCLFAATFALIVLYSHWQQPLGGERYFESCQSLDPQVPCVPEQLINHPLHTVTITQTAPPTTKTMIVEPPVQPVVFALIMYSEVSAVEGAVLLKVLNSTSLFLDPLSCVTQPSSSVRYHVHLTTPPFSHRLRRSGAGLPGEAIRPSHTPGS